MDSFNLTNLNKARITITEVKVEEMEMKWVIEDFNQESKSIERIIQPNTILHKIGIIVLEQDSIWDLEGQIEMISKREDKTDKTGQTG